MLLNNYNLEEKNIILKKYLIFFEYFKKNWLDFNSNNIINSDNIFNFSFEKSNNTCEQFNRILNSFVGMKKPKVSFLFSILKVIIIQYYEKYLNGINNSVIINNNIIKMEEFIKESENFKNKNLIFLLNQEIELFINYSPIIVSQIHDEYDENNYNNDD